jgi:hypothetical protein
MNPTKLNGAPTPASDDHEIERLASEVDAARDRLGHLVSRLDRKRDAVGRKVPLVLLLAAFALGAGIAVATARTRSRAIQ